MLSESQGEGLLTSGRMTGSTVGPSPCVTSSGSLTFGLPDPTLSHDDG